MADGTTSSVVDPALEAALKNIRGEAEVWSALSRVSQIVKIEVAKNAIGVALTDKVSFLSNRNTLRESLDEIVGILTAVSQVCHAAVEAAKEPAAMRQSGSAGEDFRERLIAEERWVERD